MARLLLVEDDPFVGKLMDSILVNAGYETHLLDRGELAWDALQGDLGFDLILLDRRLPDMDGLELLKRIKQDSRFDDIPVIMETGMGEVENIREGLSQGAYYYLTKPVNARLLLAVVSAALNMAGKFRKLSDSLYDVGETFDFLQSARFVCRTPQDARHLAYGLAKLFAQPQRAATGLIELLVNAIEHGNLELGAADKARLMMEDQWHDEIARRLDQSPYAERRVLVEVSRDDDALTLRIADEGKGFDWKNYLHIAPERALDPHGRGIALTRLLSFNSLHYEDGGRVAVVSEPLSA
jgi:DNA-binding response OmpR family regulator